MEHERLAKEAEERDRLEQEQIRRALELSKKVEEELAAQKLGKEELEQLKLAEKLSKESFEKLHSFGDEALDKFLSGVEIVGDSSF